jgi:hypothetical protein
VHLDVLRSTAASLLEAGLPTLDVMASPLRGADGNVEFLVHCVKRGPMIEDSRFVDVVDGLLDHEADRAGEPR